MVPMKKNQPVESDDPSALNRVNDLSDTFSALNINRPALPPRKPVTVNTVTRTTVRRSDEEEVEKESKDVKPRQPIGAQMAPTMIGQVVMGQYHHDNISYSAGNKRGMQGGNMDNIFYNCSNETIDMSKAFRPNQDWYCNITQQSDYYGVERVQESQYVNHRPKDRAPQPLPRQQVTQRQNQHAEANAPGYAMSGDGYTSPPNMAQNESFLSHNTSQNGAYCNLQGINTSPCDPYSGYSMQNASYPSSSNCHSQISQNETVPNLGYQSPSSTTYGNSPQMVEYHDSPQSGTPTTPQTTASMYVNYSSYSPQPSEGSPQTQSAGYSSPHNVGYAPSQTQSTGYNPPQPQSTGYPSPQIQSVGYSSSHNGGYASSQTQGTGYHSPQTQNLGYASSSYSSGYNGSPRSSYQNDISNPGSNMSDGSYVASPSSYTVPSPSSGEPFSPESLYLNTKLRQPEESVDTSLVFDHDLPGRLAGLGGAASLVMKVLMKHNRFDKNLMLRNYWKNV